MNMFSLYGSGDNKTFQNSNFKTQTARQQFRQRQQRDSDDRKITDFIWAHTKWVNKETLEKLNIGEKEAIGEALEQIHWRSISGISAQKFQASRPKVEKEEDSNNRTYKEVLKNQGNHSGVGQLSNQGSGDEAEWTKVVNRKKVNAAARKKEDPVTIFLHNIPEDTSGAMINNAKMCKGLGQKIAMTIKKDVRDSQKQGIGQPEATNLKKEFRNEAAQEQSHNSSFKKESRKEASQEDQDFGRRLFEFTEMDVDLEVEKALKECKIGYTWFANSAEGLQGKMNDIGLKQYRDEESISVNKNKEEKTSGEVKEEDKGVVTEPYVIIPSGKELAVCQSNKNKDLETPIKVRKRSANRTRVYSSSSERCNDNLIVQSNSAESEVCLPAQNTSSQSSLCIDVNTKLRVKSRRGRPKKSKLIPKNPFEIGVKFKNRAGKKKSRKGNVKWKNSNLEKDGWQVIPNNLQGNSVKEALEILNSAESMGLVVSSNREVVLQAIVARLEKGEV
ncbi:hypothetical protein ACET3Z_027137 [Daucus carota]